MRTTANGEADRRCGSINTDLRIDDEWAKPANAKVKHICIVCKEAELDDEDERVCMACIRTMSIEKRNRLGI